MISNGEKWHYLTVTRISALFKGITSNHSSDYYCLNCFNSYATENKLRLHEIICKNHDNCRIEMYRKQVVSR